MYTMENRGLSQLLGEEAAQVDLLLLPTTCSLGH